jgi:hypothetical protein
MKDLDPFLDRQSCNIGGADRDVVQCGKRRRAFVISKAVPSDPVTKKLCVTTLPFLGAQAEWLERQ